MDQQPDKLFRDKLQGHDPAVPPHAWNRVAANVQPKRRTVWWLSAAAVALIASAAVLLYPMKNESTNVAETVTQQPPRKPAPQVKESPANVAHDEQAIAKTERAAPAQRTADEDPSERKISAPNKREQPQVKREQFPVVALPEPEPVAIAKEESTPRPVIDQANPQEKSGRKTITIVFSAEEVNEKYLSKTNQAHATTAEEEASTLKNMLDKAYDLTHNQSPLGELRQKKNEILAMNFRKDKPRTQND